MKYYIILLLLTSFSCTLKAQRQSHFPRIGQKVQDYALTISNGNKSQQVNISDYRGKWLVLDFWGSTCTSCIRSFPKINSLQEQFKDSVSIILMGIVNNNYKISSKTYTEELYNRQKQLHSLNLTTVYGEFKEDWGIYSVPTIIVINPKGVIVSKTHSLDSLGLKSIMNGTNHKLPYAYSYGEEQNSLKYDQKIPLVIQKNQQVDSLVHSAHLIFETTQFPQLYGWYGLNGKKKYKGRSWTELQGINLRTFLRLIYADEEDWSYMFNPRSDSLYREIVFDSKRLKHLLELNKTYFYSAVIDSNVDARQYLLSTLENSFGFKASLEVRLLPVYKLISLDRDKISKIRTLGKKKDIRSLGDFDGLSYTNFSTKDLTSSSLLIKALSVKDRVTAYGVLPIIDETDVHFNLDIKIKGYEYDFEQIRRSLNANGLDIVPGFHKFKCIVVKEPNPLKIKPI